MSFFFFLKNVQIQPTSVKHNFSVLNLSVNNDSIFFWWTTTSSSYDAFCRKSCKLRAGVSEKANHAFLTYELLHLCVHQAIITFSWVKTALFNKRRNLEEDGRFFSRLSYSPPALGLNYLSVLFFCFPKLYCYAGSSWCSACSRLSDDPGH